MYIVHRSTHNDFADKRRKQVFRSSFAKKKKKEKNKLEIEEMFRLFPHLHDVSSFTRSLFLRGSPLFISRLSVGIIVRDLIFNLDKVLKESTPETKIALI